MTQNQDSFMVTLYQKTCKVQDFSTSMASKHYQEWKNSWVSDGLIRANLYSLPSHNLWESGEFPEIFDYIFPDGEEALHRRNDGRLTSSSLRKIDQPYLNDGGWMAQGFDIETGQRDWFITYKPNSPRWDNEKGKWVKYENPRNQPTKPHYPAIPLAEANSIAFRGGSKVFAKWEQFRDSYQGDPEFAIWEFAKTTPNIDLHITEGYKKAVSLITQGYLAIGLSGIWNWIDHEAKEYFDYRGKKKRYKILTRYFKSLLQVKREVCLWLDEDEKPKTRFNVYLATRALGKALSKNRCKVSVVRWDPKDGKGIDDAIANNGVDWLEQTYRNRLSLTGWLYFYSQTLKADKLFNKPFLTKDDINSTVKLVGLKSEKGTGKTEALADYLYEYTKDGTPVLVLSHRVQLVRAISERFGIDSSYNFRYSQTKGALGLVLCVDSLHQSGQVNFNTENWDDFILIVDEAEQVVSHTLLSDRTAVRDHRVEVLSNISELSKNARQVILSDADLSHRSLDYFSSLIGSCSREIIQNNYLPARGRKLSSYPSPETLLDTFLKECHKLSTSLEEEGNADGKNILVATDSQKASSTWSAQNLMRLVNFLYPNLKVGVVDSETVSDYQEECYHATENIDSLVTNYNVLFYTSVIGTGVSIDVKGHFGSVFSWNQGNQSENSTRQFLGRLREGVSRYCYFKPIGNSKIGKGESETYKVKSSNKRVFKRNLENLYKLNQEALKTDGMDDHVNAYCRYVATHNLGLSSYREIVLEGLRQEGYDISYVSEINEDKIKELRNMVHAVRDENYDNLVTAIANASPPTDIELSSLEQKQELNKDERNRLRKGKMERLYGVQADKDLIQQDDQGLYPQLSLQFWLTMGRDRVNQADNEKVERYREKHGNTCYTPDLNQTQNTSKVQVLEILKIPDILNLEGKELHNDSQEIKQWWNHIEHIIDKCPDSHDTIKEFLGLTLSRRETPMRNLGKLLGRIGYHLVATGEQTTRSKTTDGKRHHIHKLVRKCDKQDEIFHHWLNKLDKRENAELINYLNDESVSLHEKTALFYNMVTDNWELLKRIAPFIEEQTLKEECFDPLFEIEQEVAKCT
jgi:hypothetical protein